MAQGKKQRLSFTGDVLTVEYPSIKKALTIALSAYPDEIRTELTRHGLKQIMGDSASGKSAAEKYAMACRRHEAMLAGQWELTSNAGEVFLEAVISAVAALQKVAPEKVREALAVKPEKAVEWKANPRVKAWIATQNAEKARKAAATAEKDELEINLE